MNGSDAQNEQAWLDHLQAECNAVMQRCGLPADRAATEAERRAFDDGLTRLEASCRSMQTAAAQFDAVGLHAFFQRIATVLQDIAAARKTLGWPLSRAAGAPAEQPWRHDAPSPPIFPALQNVTVSKPKAGMPTPEQPSDPAAVQKGLAEKIFAIWQDAAINQLKSAPGAFDNMDQYLSDTKPGASADPPAQLSAGSATQRAKALRRLQTEVSAFSTSAMQLVATDPAGAETMLAAALDKTAQAFQAQKEFLQAMPWGAEELAVLVVDRAEAMAVLQAGLGEAAIRLGKYQDARRWYQAALVELGPPAHPAKPSMQMALAQVAMLEANRARR